MLGRRGFFGGLIAGLATPAIIRTPGLLMPVKVLAMSDLAYGGVGTFQWGAFSADFDIYQDFRETPFTVDRHIKERDSSSFVWKKVRVASFAQHDAELENIFKEWGWEESIRA